MTQQPQQTPHKQSKPSDLTVSKSTKPTLKSSLKPSPVYEFVCRYPVMSGYTHQLLDWDTNACIFMNRLSNHAVVANLFKGISRLGDGWFWYVMLTMGMVLGGLQAWAKVTATIAVSLFGVLIYKLLKVKTVRPRPYQVNQVIILGERPLDVFSFPSGHTLQAVYFTLALGGFFPVLLWVMVPFAVLVALSRMILGLHYPTDVLIGAGLGFALSLITPLLGDIMVSVI